MMTEKVTGLKHRHEKELAKLVSEETLRELLPESLRDCNIHETNLYGINYWVSYESSITGILDLAKEIDKLENCEISKFGDSCLSFKTDSFIEAMPDEKVMKAQITPILPVIVKYNQAHFWKRYEIEVYKKVGAFNVRFSLKTNDYLMGIRTETRYKGEKMIVCDIKCHDSNYALYDSDVQSLGHREISRMWASSLETSNFYIYWSRNDETSKGFSVERLINVLNLGDKANELQAQN